MTNHIFISYSKKDSDFALKLADDLSAAGFKTWIDRSLSVGEDWRKTIEKNLQEASDVIVVLSPNAIESRWVQHEGSLAYGWRKRIYPLLIAQIDNFPIWAEEFQYIDFAQISYLESFNNLKEILTPPNPIQDLLDQQVIIYRQTGDLIGENLLAVIEDAQDTLTISDEAASLLDLSQRRARRPDVNLQRLFGRRREDGPQPDIEFSDQLESVQIQRKVQEVQADPAAVNDRPTGPDHLDVSKYANAFTRIAHNPDTSTPLTIGLYAAWGMGKSFLMSKIQDELGKLLKSQKILHYQKSLIKRLVLWFIRLKPVVDEAQRTKFQNWFLTKKQEIQVNISNQPPKFKFWQKGIFWCHRKLTRPPDNEINFLFVTFNAWVYSGSDHLWASLITHLYGAVEKHFGWRAWYFRLGQSYRRSLSRFIGLFVLYGALGVVLSFLLNYEAIHADWQTALENTSTFIAALLGGSALLTLPRFLESLNDLAKSLFYSRAKKLQELSSRPDFGEQIGIMEEIKKEIHTMSKLLKRGKGGRPNRLVLFIDDLDRCTHKKAVEVLQAIMLLLADEDGAPFVIFLGIDARVVVKAIEENYGKVLVDAGITGYEYLDKIIQIPFTIPPPPAKALTKFVDSLIWSSDEEKRSIDDMEKQMLEQNFEDDEEKVEETGDEQIDELQPSIDSESVPPQLEGESIEDESSVAIEITPESDQVAQTLDLPPSKELGTPEFEPGIDIQQIPVALSKEEREAIKVYTADLIPNPRRIKRIVNTYRFARLLVPNFNDEQRAKLIRWIILTEQWPFRTAWILQEVEDIFQRGDLDRTYRAKSLREVYSDLKNEIFSDTTKNFLTIDNDPELFDQFVSDSSAVSSNGDTEKVPPYIIEGTTITVADIEGEREPLKLGLRQLTFNLNPAIQDEVAKISSTKLK